MNDFKIRQCRSSHCGSVVTNPTSILEDAGLIPCLAQWVKDLALLWLWCRLAAAAAVRTRAWEIPCAGGMALKKKKKKDSCPSQMGLLHVIPFLTPTMVFWHISKINVTRSFEGKNKGKKECRTQ